MIRGRKRVRNVENDGVARDWKGRKEKEAVAKAIAGGTFKIPRKDKRNRARNPN